MKSIHYDSDGDILTITFVEVNERPARGVELSDNVVLYYDTKTKEPVELVLVSYRAMIENSTARPLQLDGIKVLPEPVRNSVLKIVRKPPVAYFLRVIETRDRNTPASFPVEILTPMALKAVA